MSKTVLLIEDIPITQQLYQDALLQSGYMVDSAADGKVALEKTKSKIYDFILVDLLLPELNGIMFLEQYKNRPDKTKIMVLTDFYETKVSEQAKELGVISYLIKSEYPPSKLIEKLDSLSNPV